MLRILIADDEQDSLDGMLNCVPWEEKGYTVVGTASDGLMAYGQICEKFPDIVLIDIQMPGLSGLQVIEKVRHELEINTAFVILSGYEDFSYAKRAIQLDVVDYLLKPFRPVDLLSAIQSASKKINAVAQAKSGEEDDFFSFYSRHNAAFAPSEINPGYPRALEAHIMDRLRLGAGDESLSYADDFLNAISGAATFIALHYTMMLYQEVMRLVVERGNPLGNPFTALSWNDGNYLQNIRTALKETISTAVTTLKGNKDVSRIVSSAAAYIREHYREDISLEKVALAAYTSPTYLSAVFKQEVGIGFVDYINKTRIDAAKKLLAETNLLTYEISEEIGYKDAKYFSQVFKKLTQMTPSQYRKQASPQVLEDYS